MKTDLLTYILKSMKKQTAVNIMAAIVLMSFYGRIVRLDREVKALSASMTETEAEGESE